VIQGKNGPASVESINVFQQSMMLRYEDGAFEKLTWKEFNQLEKKRQFMAALKARGTA
jgi:hypothetical protein